MTPTKSNRRIAVAAVSTLAAFMGVPQAANAIDIQLTFNSGASDAPAADPNGTRLPAIMNHVASFYENVFRDNHTIIIDFYYDDLDPGTLGQHTLLSQSGGRENSARIRFDTPASWYYDTTPNNNSEFNVSQTLWRNLTSTERTQFYANIGSVPQTFETGFAGLGNGSDPGTATASDILSVAFHEIGHALGMSASNNSTVSETNDGDYDFESVNVLGTTLAARHAAPDNIAHLENSNALLNPSVGQNRRRLPSHTDLLAMAQVHNYTQIDLPRKEYYGGTAFNLASNWSGNRVPDIDDDTFIRRAGPNGEARNANLSAHSNVRTLTVSEGGIFATQQFNLTAFNGMLIDGAGSSVRVDSGGSISSGGSILIQNGGLLFPFSGLTSAVTINNFGSISGTGTVQVGTRLNNAGTITAIFGPLTIKNNGSFAQIDLDGQSAPGTLEEDGVVDVSFNNSPLNVIGPMSDAFNGVMTVGPNTVFIEQPWTLGTLTPSGSLLVGSEGRLNLGGNATNNSVITGATATLRGIVNVTGQARFDAPVIHTPESSTTVNNGATLRYVAGAEFAGGNFSGGGTIVMDGNVAFTSNVTFNNAAVDLDGLVTGGHTYTVFPGVTARFNSSFVGGPFTETLTIQNAARFIPSSTLTATGPINFNGGTYGGSTGGLNHTGFMQVTGNSGIDSAVALNNGTINVNGASTMTINGSFQVLTDRTLNKSGTGVLIINGAQPHSGTPRLNVNAGTTIMNTNAGASGANLIVAVTGSTSPTTLQLNTTQRVRSLTMNANGNVNMSGSGNTSVLRTPQLTIADQLGVPAATLNLGDETLVVDYTTGSPFNTIANQIRNARGANTWTGRGISSTNAAAAPNDFAIGFAEASAIGSPATFAGEAIDSTTVLARFTRMGDANLDRTVGIGDFSLLAANFNISSSTWAKGDFDFNGITNLGDFALLAANFGQTVAADLPRGNTVPEPALASLLSVALLGRRRRN